ncbi:MAG TPA: hypothetical protein ENF81_09485 [Thermotogaceae bacterium]|nr:hypothetical protein [Thermotogota bacterium]HEW92757.1 hypothetical protein [Thermotogaceae bacterium]
MFIPSSILKKVLKEFKVEDSTIHLELINPLMSVTITKLEDITIDDKELPKENVTLELGDKKMKLNELKQDERIPFKVGDNLKIKIENLSVEKGKHVVKFNLKTREFGSLNLKFDVEI